MRQDFGFLRSANKPKQDFCGSRPPPRNFQGLLKRLLPPAAAHHTGRIARVQGTRGRNEPLGSASCGEFGPLPLVGIVSRPVSVSAFAECRCISPDRGDPPATFLTTGRIPTLTTSPDIRPAACCKLSSQQHLSSSPDPGSNFFFFFVRLYTTTERSRSRTRTSPSSPSLHSSSPGTRSPKATT